MTVLHTPLWKQRRIVDPEHVLYVSRQAPILRGLPAAPTDPNKPTPRRADAHHLPNYRLNRRHCDLFVVPFDREKHDWIATEDGKRWERDNILLLYRTASRYMYINGRISAAMFDEIQIATEYKQLLEWIDKIISTGGTP